MPTTTNEETNRALRLDTVQLTFLPLRTPVLAEEFGRVFLDLQLVVGLVTDGQRPSELVLRIFGEHLPNISAPCALEVERIEFGSPLKIIGKIADLSTDSRFALLRFFRNMIFYDQEVSKRAADAALAWEQVYAARIENAKAVASASTPKRPNETDADHADRVADRTGDLLGAASRLRGHELRLVEVTIGDETVRRTED